MLQSPSSPTQEYEEVIRQRKYLVASYNNRTCLASRYYPSITLSLMAQLSSLVLAGVVEDLLETLTELESGPHYAATGFIVRALVLLTSVVVSITARTVPCEFRSPSKHRSS